ncbi:MAG: class II aldolase/adducin family protein [Vicinamibacteria bacterium]
MKTIDLSGLRVVSAKDVEDAVRQGATALTLAPRAVVTPSARDAMRRHGCEPTNGGSAPAAGRPAAPSVSPAHERLFRSPEAEAAKAEIIAAGRKLWQRSYVDGNGGNISFRLAENAVLCTPTLVSKADLTPDDLCMVDLDGNQLAGKRARTSEILMHLEIYKAVPQAKAVLHCHPPHATAYAITGRVPPTCVIPEYEVFVGGAALAKYETPGTQAFADAVLPFVKDHNTLLLQNHGIVCWADTVTHAEWYAEVLDTYCWTLMLAQQLGAPITYIPQEKAADLLAIKKRLGLPDARLDGGSLKECQLCDLPDMPGAIAVAPPRPGGQCACAGNGSCPASRGAAVGGGDDVEALVAAVTDAVMAALQK